jgi:hypothetical protein
MLTELWILGPNLGHLASLKKNLRHRACLCIYFLKKTATKAAKIGKSCSIGLISEG